MIFLYRRGLKSSEGVIFQNSDDEKLFYKLKIISKNQSSHIVNGSGVDLEKFKFSTTVVQKDKFVFLLISRLMRDKGIYEYIEAIKITTKAANRYSYNGQKTQRIKALINLTEILLLADENYEAKKLATSILQLTSKEDTLAASAFHLLGRVEFNDASPRSLKSELNATLSETSRV